MHLDVALLPCNLLQDSDRGRSVVVVDVFRASTSIITALANGARKVIPFEEADEARTMASSMLEEDVLLCGERGGKRIPGFDLGNSPAEYTRDAVSGKTLLFTTTNGTQMLRRCMDHEAIWVAGFVNIQDVVDRMSSKTNDVVIACSGQDGRCSLEDAVCAGGIVDGVLELDDGVRLSDAALASRVMYRHFKHELREMADVSNHGRFLAGLGMASDLDACVRRDVYDVIPVLEDSALVAGMG